MNTAIVPSPTAPNIAETGGPASRFFRTAIDGQSYRNVAYLLLGLPLGTLWFSVLVTGVTVGVSMLVVALLGVPILLGMWYVIRASANVERAVADALVGTAIPLAPWGDSSRLSGNPWRRLRRLSSDSARRREAAFLMLRFPAGIVTFTAAVAALFTPFAVIYAPLAARIDDSQPFGDWAYSDRLESIFGSEWAWAFVPLGLLLLITMIHATNALARACGRLASRWLG